jgi:hypothetical protein
LRRTMLVAARRVPFLAFAFVLLTVAACGYQLSGMSTFLPQDIRTIYVEPFMNRSRDVGIEKEITTALRGEFYRRGQLRIVDQAEQADAIVSGVVRAFDSSVVSVNRKDEVLQYESIMTLDVTLRRREPNEIIWRGQGTRLRELHSGSRAAVVTTSSEFRTGTLNAADVRQMTDIQLTETENQQFRDALIERFARELHQRLMEMF